MRWLVSRGWHGWALVGVLVVTFDVAAAAFGGESMTDAARRWFQHGVARWFVLAGIVYFAIHLTVMPYRTDPLDRAFDWVRQRVSPPSGFENPPRPEDAPRGKD